MLKDRERTAVVVVTLPEEMPITETIEGYRELERAQEVPLGPVLVNCTEPVRLDGGEIDLVYAMADVAEARGDSTAAFSLRHAAERSRWTAERRERVEGLKRSLPGARFVKVPLFAGAVAGMTLTENVALALETAASEGDRGSS
jgi:anion-transporting  ArsA/GET3 family ATPase